MYRGHERLRLIADLAMNELSHREIASRIGVTTEDVYDFAEDHVMEISEVRSALAGKLAIESAGLWISKKQNRLAEYQAEAEEIRDFLSQLRQSNIRWSRSHRDMLRTYLEILRHTADELGAYPQRQSAPARQGQTVHYVIETDDTRALQ
jgi:hypothetical protein